MTFFRAIIHSAGGKQQEMPLPGNSIEPEELPLNAEKVELRSQLFEAGEGEDGYFVLPTITTDHMGNGGIVRFRPRQNMRVSLPYQCMPIFGICRGDRAILAVIDGSSLGYSMVLEVRDGRYALYPEFPVPAPLVRERISVALFELSGEDADYSGIARRYRRYQLERGACVPISERIAGNPVLEESIRSIAVRLRLAWKMVPPEIDEQTEENEPAVKVGLTFRQVGEILEEYSRQGLRHADCCLVGWNKSGHDGRFPDLLPVEPLLGGESALKQLTARSRELGYLMGAHTNLLDSYTISRRLDRADWLLDADGTPHPGGRWGGGQSRHLCPRQAFRYALEDVETLKALGFSGSHYYDGMTLEGPLPCHSAVHPLTRTQSGEWRTRTMAHSQKLFGGCSSEGPMDYCVGALDFALYASFRMNPADVEHVDMFVPLWHLVYHGIVTYNCYCDTVNYMFKNDPVLKLRNQEYGGRPAVYYYASFLTSGNHWMGTSDPGCRSSAEIRESTEKIKPEADDYEAESSLQLAFMEHHEAVAPGVFETRYSDGTCRRIDYNKLSMETEKI